jgi:hypothetical protein
MSQLTAEAPPRRADPITLLEEQAESRVPELVPVRWGRMDQGQHAGAGQAQSSLSCRARRTASLR